MCHGAWASVFIHIEHINSNPVRCLTSLEILSARRRQDLNPWRHWSKLTGQNDVTANDSADKVHGSVAA